MPQKCQRFIYIYLSFLYTSPQRRLEGGGGWGGGYFRLKSPRFCLIDIILFFLASRRPRVLSVRIDTMNVLNASLALCLCKKRKTWSQWNVLCFCVGAILWYRQAIFRPRPVFMHFTGSRINTQLIWKVSDTFHWCVWCVCVGGGGGGGAGIAQWLERRTRDQKVAGSNPCWSGGRIFFSGVNFLCWLLFRYPFHPRVTAVARKRPRSFCQRCR